MPNKPALVGRGVSGAVANRCASEAHRERAERFWRSCGTVERPATEAEIDALTAVSGCGPACVFLLVEVMAAAGRNLGLSDELAMRLARRTVDGAGEVPRGAPEDAATLRERVTSPGGHDGGGARRVDARAQFGVLV